MVFKNHLIDLKKAQDPKKIWTKKYGEILLKRAKQQLPEMESSKSTAEKVKKSIRSDDRILDIGCGLGHYYISLKKRIDKDFDYYGLDIIDDYITKARKLFQDYPNVNFKKGSIFSLPFKKNSFDIVMCNNFLHNLSSIQKPIGELLRVSNRYTIIRTLVGDRSFRIQEVRNSKWSKTSSVNPVNEFKKDGEPKEFNFFNIYSRDYLKGLIKKYAPNSKINFTLDMNFDPKAIRYSAKKEGKQKNATSIIGNYQVNDYIIMPWTFIEIRK